MRHCQHAFLHVRLQSPASRAARAVHAPVSLADRSSPLSVTFGGSVTRVMEVDVARLSRSVPKRQRRARKRSRDSSRATEATSGEAVGETVAVQMGGCVDLDPGSRKLPHPGAPAEGVGTYVHARQPEDAATKCGQNCVVAPLFWSQFGSQNAVPLCALSLSVVRKTCPRKRAPFRRHVFGSS